MKVVPNRFVICMECRSMTGGGVCACHHVSLVVFGYPTPRLPARAKRLHADERTQFTLNPPGNMEDGLAVVFRFFISLSRKNRRRAPTQIQYDGVRCAQTSFAYASGLMKEALPVGTKWCGASSWFWTADQSMRPLQQSASPFLLRDTETEAGCRSV